MVKGIADREIEGPIDVRVAGNDNGVCGHSVDVRKFDGDVDGEVMEL